MTFFSRCGTWPIAEPGHPAATARRARRGTSLAPQSALAGFAEDLGILFRYALGLDYQSGIARRRHDR